MTSPVSIVAGADILASDFDAYESLTAAWTSYTPAWTSAGTAPSLGNGSINGKYVRVGLFMFVQVKFIAGSTSTYGTGSFRFSLPSGTANNAGVDAVGSAVLLDSGTTRWAASCEVTAAASYALVVARNDNHIEAASPFTWATSDSVTLSICYQT